jgi:hypothetical protein
MKEAYQYNAQFIFLLVVIYVIGVWFEPFVYILFPFVFGMFGLKKRFLELFITSLWLLILSDYIPVSGATYADLQFAKTLKPIIPIFLFGFYYMNRDEFPVVSKIFTRLIPFFIVAFIALKYSIKLDIGIKKYISFVLMYFSIPLYVGYLHKHHEEHFWKSLFTFIIGMLTIGIFLGLFAPQIGILSGGRFKGILGNPNGLGIFLNLTFILWTVIKEFRLADFTPRENLFIGLVIFVSLFWCGSRNGMMSVFLFYLTYRFVKIHWAIAIVVVTSFIVFQDLIFLLFIEILQFFQLSDYFRVDTIEKGSGRKVAWVFAWQEIQKYYFIGGSFGHDENVMRPNYYWLERLGHNGGVHNSYLSMWFDSGIIGLILYYLALLINVFKSLGSNYIGIAFLVSILFNINYESWIVASLNPFTILFLIILTIFVEQLNGFSEETVNEDLEQLNIESEIK